MPFFSGSERGAFWYLQPPRQKLSPRAGKVDTNECEWPKGEWFGGGLCFLLFPLSFAYAQQLPRLRWSLFGATTAQKLSPFTGKVAVSVSERSKGVRLGGGLRFLLFPLSHGLRRASSPACGGAVRLVQPPFPQSLPVEGGGFCEAKAGGSRKKLAAICLVQPLS